LFVHIEKVVSSESKTTSKIGEKVRLRFQISQHSRDEALLKSFIEYFDYGNYYPRSSQNVGNLVVTNFSYIHSKILPFLGEISYLWC